MFWSGCLILINWKQTNLTSVSQHRTFKRTVEGYASSVGYYILNTTAFKKNP